MKNRAPIIVAVLVGVVAVLAINSYVQKVRREADARLRGSPVVAARSAMDAGTEITLDAVYPKEVPEQFIPAQAIMGSQELKQIIGRKLRVAVQEGQLLLWSDLESVKRGGLATIVPADERAFTIQVTKGVSPTLLQPNDHVDIIASFAVPEARTGAQTSQPAATWRQRSDVVTVVLLQNVTVLALGENFAGGSPGAPEGPGAGGDVTVSLTLPESQLLMFASQHGELGIALRKEGNIATVEREKLPRVTFADLEQLIGNLDLARKQRIVQIVKGTEKTEEVSVGTVP